MILNEICVRIRHNCGNLEDRTMEPLYNEVRGQTIFEIEKHYNMLVDNDKNKRITETTVTI